MMIEIKSTDAITVIDGVPVRIWKGITQGGHRVYVFVHRLAACDDGGADELASELSEEPTPQELLFVMRVGPDYLA